MVGWVGGWGVGWLVWDAVLPIWVAGDGGAGVPKRFFHPSEPVLVTSL